VLIALAGMLVISSGCERTRSDQRTTGRDTTRSGSGVTSGITSAPALQAAPGPREVDPEARAACDEAATLWASIPAAALRQADTVMHPSDVLGDSVLAHRGKGAAVAACLVAGHLEQGADSATRERLSWRAADGFRGRNGWGAIWRIAADGPDGFEETYQRGRVRCQVMGWQDGGDDSDSTYVPDPFYAEEITCWRHGRDIVPIDTAPWRP
jgi:hypothetical protein